MPHRPSVARLAAIRVPEAHPPWRMERSLLWASAASFPAWADSAAIGSRGFGSIVSAGSCLIGLTNGSELVVFKPDGKAYSEIKRYKVSETPIYAHPIVAGNRIYIKDQEQLTLWTL